MVIDLTDEDDWFCVTARPMEPKDRAYYQRGGK